MAKLYKLTIYAVDPNDYYDNAIHCYNQLIMGDRSGSFYRADRDELLTSKEFKWDDKLSINYCDAKKEDFESYFQKET